MSGGLMNSAMTLGVGELQGEHSSWYIIIVTSLFPSTLLVIGDAPRLEPYRQWVNTINKIVQFISGNEIQQAPSYKWLR